MEFARRPRGVVSRRRLLGAGCGLVATSLTGCLAGHGNAGSSYRQWLFEPGTVGAERHYRYAHLRPSTVDEFDRHLPADVIRVFESHLPTIPALDVRFDRVQAVTVGNQVRVLEASFSADRVAGELVENGPYREAGEIGSYALLTHEQENTALGIGEDVVVVSRTPSEGTAATVVSRTIETKIHAVNGYHQEDEDFRELTTALGAGFYVTGTTHDRHEETALDLGLLRGSVAEGRALRHTAEGRLEASLVVVFEAPKAVYPLGVEELAAQRAPSMTDVTVSTDGRVATATGMLEPSEVTIQAYHEPTPGWPTFQQNAANTGSRVGGQGPREDVVERWRAETDRSVSGSPAVTEDAVVVNDFKSLYVLSRASGSKRWSADRGPYGSGSPAVVDETVFIGAPGWEAIRAFALEDGSLEWETSLDERVMVSPAVVDELVVAGAADGTVFALDREDGSQRWTAAVDGVVRGAITIQNDQLLVGSDSGVSAIDRDRGEQLWHTETPEIRRSAPAAIDGRIFVGTAGSIVALRSRDGGTLWETEIGTSHTFSTPAVGDDAVFVGGIVTDDAGAGNEGRVVALDRDTGVVEWTLETAGRIVAAPSIDDEMLYTATRSSDDDGVIGVDRSSGEVAWGHALDKGVGYSSPAVADGTLYVGTLDNAVLALEAPGS
jgi:outer membrane protein assembly factor BamB